MMTSFFSVKSTGRKNLLQLIRLRWIAVAGQLLAIAVVYAGLHVNLPLTPMLAAIAFLILLNLLGHGLRRLPSVPAAEIFLFLLFDIAALTWQFYFSGGASNPFVWLYLLQIALGCVLLGVRAAWALVIVTSLCFAGLAVFFQPLALPPALSERWFSLYLLGSLVCFVLLAGLLAWFVSRVVYNLRDLDASVAALRQRAAEEDLIVRMGLLASGAAHELGTPLSSLSVILGDWKRVPALAADPDRAQEITEMQAEVQRCKSIVTGILLAAGEARGENPAVTSLNALVDRLAAYWRELHPQTELAYNNGIGADASIISDPVLEKVIFNVLDNAFDVSPAWVGFTAHQREDALVLQVTDAGPGFSPEMLENFGKPYFSSKGRPGGGLGLFLVVNVMRKLGGTAEAVNRPEGGACVILTLPLSMLSPEGGRK
ncbi:MAG: ATP-binding protein [Micavibrio sp.]|nr:ATP-binding protein [Micavibrio sp.]